MKIQPALSLKAAFAAVVLSGCARDATVATIRPRLHPLRTTAAALISVQQDIVRALREEKGSPSAAIGGYLNAAQTAAQQLQRDPKDTEARDAYNYAVSRVISALQKAKLDPWTQPLHVPAPDGGEYILTHRHDPRPEWNPALYDFTPADEFDVGGVYVTERTTRDGIGAPLVAVGRGQRGRYREDFALPRTYYGVTAVARFDRARRCVLSFEDPLASERVTIGSRTFPLAADFTVPLAVLLARENPERLGLSRMLQPAKFTDTARIARLQPYDPDKTVVLVVHGLMSEPSTWTPMINTLRGDAEIRKHYQFWFYSYPSGYPYPYAAAILRRELDAIQKRFPTRRPMVVIGHSMGGCISRLLITDTGDRLWMDIFEEPPDEVQLPPDDLKLFTEALIFRHRPEVGRVIFISAPLRGSELARNWVGRIGSMLVKAPTNLIKAGADVLTVTSYGSDDLKLKRIPNSVDTLAPNNRFVKAIQKIPLTPGIPYHVISGDRGKGGNKDQTKPVMSDGVVPYWSSHMEGAQSELVVPSSHSAHQNPEAIAEVERILKQHRRR
jgi:pimeloyl-ACP methyl ester carboxylesterase